METSATTSLSANEQRVAWLLEAFGQGVWEWDVQARAVHFSPDWLRGLGYDPGEVADDVGSWASRVHPEDLDRVRDGVLGHLEGRTDEFAVEFRVRLCGGGWRWSSCRGKVVERTQDGSPTHVVGITSDITARRELEAQVLQGQRLESIGHLAGAVAHDFNNLLTVINGYSEIALGSLDPRDPLHGSITEIKSAGDRAAALTQQLLAFSRRQVMQPEVLSVSRVLADAESVLRRLLGHDVELVVSSADEATGHVKADPLQLQQVLMNLAMNAREAMPGGGRLVIETSNVQIDEEAASGHPGVVPGPYVRISVADQGVGMNEETLARVFEPFFTTKEKGKGTGLGLSTVYGIVKQSGGHVCVQSRVGGGSTFRIYLPRVAAEEEKPVGRAVVTPVASGSETILLVEDQPEVRQLAFRALSLYGYRVLSAACGAEALVAARAESGSIDLLLTDVVMPGMTGPALAKAMCDLRPGIKVLLMSGYADQAALPGKEQGDIECIQKPFTPDALARKVRETLDSRTGARRVLVVDDEAEIRRLLRQFLEHAGYDVAEAANGRQAVDEVNAGGVSLVITDLVMPEQEGIETIREMRRRYRDVKIIAMSGAFGGRFLRTAEMLGAHATLSKPVRAEQLVRTVGQVLGAA